MNLAQSLLGAAERHPDAEAVVEGGTRLTYAQLLDRAARLDVRRNQRVAALVKPGVDAATLYWGCQWAGATFVPLSYRATQADLDYCRADCGADALVDLTASALPLAQKRSAGALDIDEGEESLLLYTSGTTGRPKGVPRSHRADRAAAVSQALQHGYRHGDRTLGVMPLYHTMGIHSLLAMHVLGGCYVCQADWDAGAALELIERERITSLYLAPTLFHDLVWHPRRGDYDVSSVEVCAYAGAAMTAALVDRVAEMFEPRLFVNHYGSTEIYTFSVHRDQRAKPGCAGRPALNARLRLGEHDEVLCHMGSDEAFAGYWQRPDADERIRDGWYHTGDVARIDEDGDLWIVGRVDDMIVSGGENIHPLEVEDVVASHPAVREVACVGVADERLGHRVAAFVVCEQETTAEELDAHCLASDRLARFKRPREYRFVSELPKSASGKILRRMLRDEVTA